MPRKPLDDNPLFVELREALQNLDSEKARKIAYAKNEIDKEVAKIEYLKCRAIIERHKWGLSVYALAKAAGIKSAKRRSELLDYCNVIVDEYESEGA